ncbi:hypothetical protein LCGC14_2340370, partial [marine sediment metagenome]
NMDLDNYFKDIIGVKYEKKISNMG